MTRLEIAKGLEKEEPFAEFEKRPDENTISQISKKLQTQEMLDRIFSHPKDPKIYTWPLLSVISKNLITRDNCIKAILRDNRNVRKTPETFFDDDFCDILFKYQKLRCLPKKNRTMERCLAAVAYSWTELKYVPEHNKSEEICECALEQSLGAIAFLPAALITKEIAAKAVMNSVEIMAEAEEKECRILWPIEYVPKRMLSKKLVRLSASISADSVLNLPERFITKEIALSIVQKNGLSLRRLPDIYKTDDSVINAALLSDPGALRFVPVEKKTYELCNTVFTANPEFAYEHPAAFPEVYRDEFLNRYKVLCHNKIVCLETPEQIENKTELSLFQPLSQSGNYELYDLSGNESEGNRIIYYISDLHIEHQLNLVNKPLFLIEEEIDSKIDEFISTVPDTDHILLIPGDIADGFMLSELFYQKLLRRWKGQIVSTLGNHELWDTYQDDKENYSVDNVIKRYKSGPMNRGKHSIFLENNLLLFYKGMKWVVISEQEINETDQEELKDICKKSTAIIFGGIGFSWRNPAFNADTGLYRDKLSRSNETKRSKRFLQLYKKVKDCAGQNRVIILTHNPPEDWLDEKPHPNWIYVCGHTHRNRMSIEDNGPILLNNNQVGYRPCKWCLKGFRLELKARHDPLAYLKNGIHDISPQQYIDFNQCSGINMISYVRTGRIYALKYDDVYMFLYQEHTLSILNGGALKKADHDIEYYYKNMPLFISQVKKAFEPYHKTLKTIGSWIKEHDGSGYVHGCIVDIDFFNHIYLDPYDAKVNFYFAEDMTKKLFFKNLNQLINESPVLSCKESFQKAFMSGNSGMPKLLTDGADPSIAPVPEFVMDRAMYEPSRNMRAVQYALENNVIRFWRDAILEYKIAEELENNSQIKETDLY